MSDEMSRGPLPASASPSGDGPSVGAPAPAPVPVRFSQPIADGWLEWAVVEVDAARVPGARGARCLLFTRTDCIRRVWDYPADWRTLNADELAALSWRR